MAKKLELTFAKAKDTANKSQFKEVGTQFMGAIYMDHGELEKMGNPTELNVVVTPKS